MNKKIMALFIAGLAMPLFAEETNKVENVPSKQEEKESVANREEKFEGRHLALLHKTLSEIGVTEEQRQQIIELQKEFREKMKKNWIRMHEAREKLSRLQDEGADMDQLNAAIQEIADAQTEQLQILVMNRMQMEKILGKEKNDKFMEEARKQYRKQGRRPGPDMPPKPGVTPDDQNENIPPPPPQADASPMPPLPQT